jgi:hypothetical protein
VKKTTILETSHLSSELVAQQVKSAEDIIQQRALDGLLVQKWMRWLTGSGCGASFKGYGFFIRQGMWWFTGTSWLLIGRDAGFMTDHIEIYFI